MGLRACLVAGVVVQLLRPGKQGQASDFRMPVARMALPNQAASARAPSSLASRERGCTKF